MADGHEVGTAACVRLGDPVGQRHGHLPVQQEVTGYNQAPFWTVGDAVDSVSY